jgi:hypothetical protein
MSPERVLEDVPRHAEAVHADLQDRLHAWKNDTLERYLEALAAVMEVHSERGSRVKGRWPS